MRARIITGIAACCLVANAEILDRIAVALDRHVITRSAIDEQVRVSAFLDRRPADLAPTARRRMAERMIEQTLLRREMEASRFPLPSDAEARPLLERIRGEYADNAAFQAALKTAGVSEDALLRNLTVQLTTLRFIELRFRPGSTVAEGEIEIHYREVYTPAFEKARPNQAVPDIEDARDEIEQSLLQVKVDQALDAWLRETRTRARVRFFEEAFQ